MTEQDYRKKFVANALLYNGVKTGSNDHKSIVDIYNSQKVLPRGYKVKYTDPWCATYVSTISINCNMTGIIPTECSCNKMLEQFKKLNCWVESDAHIPSPGDIVFFDWEDDGVGDNFGSPNHVGIVVNVKDRIITVIEGNNSGAHGVGYRYIQVNGRFIRGFAKPNFKSLVKTQYKAPYFVPIYIGVLSKDVESGYVKAAQTLLNKHLSCNLTVDGKFGPKTEDSVKNFQKSKNILVDGIIGPNTWKSLLSFE